MTAYETNVQEILDKLDEIKDYVRDQNVEMRNEISRIQSRCSERAFVYERAKSFFNEPLLPWIDTASMWFGRVMWAAAVFAVYKFLESNYFRR